MFVDKEYSPPNVTVEVDGVTAAHVGDHVTVWCRVSNIHTLSSIDFLYNRSVVASFSIRTENVSNLHPRFTLALLKEHDGYSLNLTLTNVTCSDAGRYTCLARDERKDVEKWTRLSVMSKSVLGFFFKFLFYFLFAFCSFILFFFPCYSLFLFVV